MLGFEYVEVLKELKLDVVIWLEMEVGVVEGNGGGGGVFEKVV